MDALDSIQTALEAQFAQLDAQVGNVLNEMQTSLVNATILPNGFDLPCNLGAEFLARFESMIGIGPDVDDDDVALAAAVVAILARGPPVPFSPSAILSDGIKSGVLAPHMRTVLPFQILPAIAQAIGSGAFNDALQSTLDSDPD